MPRAILAFVVGYVVMVLIVVAGLAGAWLILGIDRVYEPGTYDVTTMWIGMSFGAGLVAAIAGGLACVLIALRPSRVPLVLAIVSSLVGVGMAVPHFLAEEPETKAARTEDSTMADIAQNSRTPTISVIGNPIIGFIGILIGARLGRKSQG